jgi:outer membrane protein assembly factor BamB
VADNEHLADRWPDSGPPLAWRYSVGAGYAGPVVGRTPAGELRLVIYHRQADRTVAECLDVASGKPLWRAAFPTAYASSIAPDDGPRCGPLIHAGAVYLFSAEGDVHCLDFATGAVRWSRSLGRELDAPPGYFGFGSTPIVAGERLLLNVGARGAGIVALALGDGKTIWQATNDAASYSSPIATTLGGRQRVIFVTRLHVVSVDPATGAEGFRIPFGMRGPTVNAATPLLLGDRLFVTANYGVGARLLRLADDRAEEIWSSDDLLSSQYVTPVLHQGTLYGIDGRQDVGVARLRAVDPLARRVMWTKDEFGMASLILADEKLLAMKVDGTLKLIAARPDGYRELASAELFDSTTQALPALAEGRFFARDTQTLKCFDLRGR